MMSRALETRILKLEHAASDQSPGLCVVMARTPEAAEAMIAEGERRGEIGPNDTTVILQRWSKRDTAFRPYRVCNGRTVTILSGVAEPAIGTPWLDDLEHREPAGRA